ncbi:MAG: glycosyltransferase family 2 protein [Patescibacteria group bacterium]
MINKKSLNRLTISLVTHNGQRWLPYCLESIAKQTWQDFFFLIIDNGSLDRSVFIINDFLNKHSDFKSRSRLIQHKTNVGFARAHNQALAWSDSQYVFLLNQDIKLSDSYLSDLIGQLDKQPAAAAATGRLRRWILSAAEGGEISETDGKFLIDSAGLFIKRSRRVQDRGAGQIDIGQYDKPSLVFGVSGAAPVYRRSALQAVAIGNEILDEDFFSYKEDVDLAWRLQRAGYAAIYWPAALAYHDRSLQSGQGWRAYRSIRRQRLSLWRVYSWTNHLFVLLKNDSWFNLIRDLPWWGSYELAKLLYMLFLETSIFKKSLIRLLTLTPVMLKKRKILKTSWQRPASQIRGWWLK